ncbi:MAG: response regulator [Anaerolineae bacterium]|nr:response regulator [Anaerolineae bacterium]
MTAVTLLTGAWITFEWVSYSYLNLRSLDADKVDLFFETQLAESRRKLHVFVTLSEAERLTTAESLFADYSDIYRLNTEFQVEQIYKFSPGSRVFQGFSFAGGKLGKYLEAVEEEDVFSDIIPGYEDNIPSLYYAYRDNGYLYLGRMDLIYIREFMMRYAQFSGTPLMLVSQDGFVMASSDPDLNIYSFDLKTWGDMSSTDRTLFVGGQRWRPLVLEESIIGAGVVILTPMDFPDTLRRSLAVFLFIFLGGLVFLTIIKNRQISQFVLEPISHLTRKLQELEYGRLSSATDAVNYRFDELISIHNRFRVMAQAIVAREQRLKASEGRTYEMAQRIETANKVLRESEERLRESEANFRQIFAANPFPLLITQRKDSEIIMANQAVADYLELPLDEVIGSRSLNFYADPTDRPVVIQELAEQGKITNRVFRVKTYSGREMMMLLNMIPIKFSGKDCLLSGLADITAQIEAETVAQEAKIAAERANRAKSVFLANMTHELRTPLNAVLGYSQLMLRDVNLTPEQRENLEIIGRSGEHLLALIDDVLDLSKIEMGKAELQCEVFDLHKMLLGLGEMFSLRAKQKGLSLVFDFSPDVPRYVQADVGKLRQVLINLLGNAIKFTEHGGIRMQVSRKPEVDLNFGVVEVLPSDPTLVNPFSVLLHFEIKDTGAGIVSEELDKVFAVFEQTESGRKSKVGTGLGLPISREYVRMMGGDLFVSSEVGVGTCFYFDVVVEVMDAAMAQLQNTRQSLRAVALSPEQPVYKLLVVDDVDTGRQLLVKLLSPLGFNVREAANGREVLAIWQEWQPDLIFMDIRMPAMDGREATRQIRALPGGTETIIIAMTASAFDENREAFLAEGCDDLVRKPFLEATIFTKLEQYLGVQFVYEIPEVQSETPIAVSESEFLALRVSSEWRSKMHQAIVEGDFQWIEYLVEQIRDMHPGLAKKITELTANFAYDELLHLLEDTVENE